MSLVILYYVFKENAEHSEIRPHLLIFHPLAIQDIYMTFLLLD